MSMEAVNPATGETLETYPEMTPEETEKILEQVSATQRQWRRVSMEERGEHLRRAAELLRRDAGEHARRMALEMGKPLAEGRSEAEKCAWVCDYYAEHGAEFLAPEQIETDASRSYVTYQPLGVVLAVMPWNFPYWQVFRFAAPGLMAGNGALLKHAANVPGCALAIEEVLREAGFPEHLFRTLLISSGRVGDLLGSPHVQAATLTGSTRAGQAVAGRAGKELKKTVLELGGSDPYLILEDADLEAAVETCVKSRLINTGQSCIAAKRFVVVEPVRHTVEELFLERLAKVRMGDPLDEDSDIGPMARADLRDELHEQVQKSRKKGARCLLGGHLPEREGAYYPPTLLADVAPGMPAYDEELFGPVASILPVADEEEAIRVANDSPFGLGAAVFTGDVARGERIAAERLEAGCCFVNGFVRSDPRLPFGGIKQSGYGRELSHHGIREFTNVKTVWIK